MRGFGGSNKWYDRWRDGSKDSIEQQLILSCPDIMSRICGGNVIGSDYGWWTREFAIYEAHEIEANQKCVELKFPGTVVGCSEF